MLRGFKFTLLLTTFFLLNLIYAHNRNSLSEHSESPLYRLSLERTTKRLETDRFASRRESFQERMSKTGGNITGTFISDAHAWYSAPPTLMTSCGGTCETSCGGGNTCTSSCQSSCEASCSTTCYSGSCSGTCGNSCGGTCGNSCNSTCTGESTCNSSSCGSSCGGTCGNSCGGTCGNSCGGTCGYTCNSCNHKPAAHIDSISPDVVYVDENVSVTFTGHGTDYDSDDILEYSWWFEDTVHPYDHTHIGTQACSVTSSMPVANDYLVSFKVKDDYGWWSPVVQENFCVWKVTSTYPQYVKEGTDRNVTIDTHPSPPWADICSDISFALENEETYECTYAGCGNGGDPADVASLSDSSVSSTDHTITLHYESRGTAELVVKYDGEEAVRYLFDGLVCACGQGPPKGEAWHAYHGVGLQNWGVFSVLSTANPTVYNCIAYSMGIYDDRIWPGTGSFADFAALYRDNCGLRPHTNCSLLSAKVVLYAKNGVPQHAGKVSTCTQCDCDIKSKWGWSDLSYVFCHPEDEVPTSYGSIARYYIPFVIDFSGVTVNVDEEKTVTVNASDPSYGLPVPYVELDYEISDTAKLEFVGWDGSNATDYLGNAKIVVKGLAVGTPTLIIFQVEGSEGISSGLTDTETITVVSD